MILLNFGSKMQKIGFEQFSALTGRKITEQIMLPMEYTQAADFIREVDTLFAKVKLTTEELKQDRYVLLPPANGHAAAILLVELHRRTGQFPYLIRTRPPLYGFNFGSDIVEVVDLEKEWQDPENE